MQIVIQTVVITWTKASRGGELATLRARIPKQLPLPLQSKLTGSDWHAMTYSEKNRFAAPVQDQFGSISLNEPFQFGDAEIDCSGDAAILTYLYQEGAPARTYYDRNGTRTPIQHSVRVSGNSWAFIEYNNRRSDLDTGAWWYEHIVVNVAIGQRTTPNKLFSAPPANQLSHLSQLW